MHINFHVDRGEEEQISTKVRKWYPPFVAAACNLRKNFQREFLKFSRFGAEYFPLQPKQLFSPMAMLRPCEYKFAWSVRWSPWFLYSPTLLVSQSLLLSNLYF